MSDPAQVTALRGKLIRMLAIVAFCVLVAIGAVIGYLSFHIAWMGAVFAVAAIAGFAAQIWLVIDFARARPPR